MKTLVKQIKLPADLDMVKLASLRVTPGFVDPAEYDRALRERNRLHEIKQGLTEMERRQSQNDVVQAATKAEAKVEQLHLRRKIFEFSNGKYQILDPSVFTLRRPVTFWPVFGVFKPEDVNSSIAVQIRRGFQSVSFFPFLPELVSKQYGDVVEKLKVIANNKLSTAGGSVERVEVKISAEFSGLIPLEVKREMNLAKSSKLFREFFVVAEVVEWKLDSIVVSRRGDPLLVGFDGYDLWLIVPFDTTSLEEEVAREFATRPDLE